MHLQIGDDRAGIVDLVAGGDEQALGRLGGERGEVALLALAPEGARAFDGVGAIGDDPGDAGAEARLYVGQARGAAVILHRIVEQGGDRLILVGAGLKRDRRDAEEMGDIGDLRSLPALGAVERAGVDERLVEPLGEAAGGGAGAILLLLICG